MFQLLLEMRNKLFARLHVFFFSSVVTESKVYR